MVGNVLTKGAVGRVTESVILNGATDVTYPAIQTITPGTGFTVSGTASDTSTYNYTVL